MKTSRIIILILALVFVGLFFVRPVGALTTPDVSQVNSYELFWPIVSGKTMADSFYSLKLFKERIRELVTFSPARKADYLITVSEKRLVEAEALYKKADYGNAQKTLAKAGDSWQRINSLIDKAKASDLVTVNLETRFTSSLEKQGLVLKYLLLNVPDAEKQTLNEALVKIKTVVSKLDLLNEKDLF